MAWSGNFMSTSFKVELLQGIHDFRLTGGDAFKIALYDNTPTFTAATTAYQTTGELAATGNYVTGGNTLTRVDPTSTSTTAYTDFADEVWSTATFTAYGALIYNSTAGTNCVIGLDFGGAKTASAGDFTVQFPAPGATAIIRIE